MIVDTQFRQKLNQVITFKILNIHEKLPKNYFKNIILGFDPKLFTYYQLEYLFGKKIDLKPVKEQFN